MHWPVSGFNVSGCFGLSLNRTPETPETCDSVQTYCGFKFMLRLLPHRVWGLVFRVSSKFSFVFETAALGSIGDCWCFGGLGFGGFRGTVGLSVKTPTGRVSATRARQPNSQNSTSQPQAKPK